ncbi:MAG: hypothetical protein GU346_06635 [Thermocrinis sp.]|jgi:hypothetical protein|nr:hypothetical protein [Thermocrinis sp.]
MRYIEAFNGRFDNKYGILSYQVRFYPDNPEKSFTVDFALVRRKRTARMRRFQSLPDLKPVAVFDVVVVDRRGASPFDVYLLDKVVEQQGKYGITIERREEYYRVNDVFVVMSYPVRKRLENDYLLLINGCKVSIPKPKLLSISYEYASHWLKHKLGQSKKLERILNGEGDLEYLRAIYPKLVYIDPEVQRELEGKEVVRV